MVEGNCSIQTLPDQASWIKTAQWLAYVTILYNLIEGGVSIYFGLHDSSFSLAGFGVDSLIEVASAFLVLWRLGRDFNFGSTLSIKRERQATFGIGMLFSILAICTFLAAIDQLLEKHHPISSIPGVIVALVSLVFMFFLWNEKRKASLALDSKTVASDASCSFACIKLSMVLLLGSLVYYLFPTLWWVDSGATIILSFLIIREGFEMISASKKENFAGGCGCN